MESQEGLSPARGILAAVVLGALCWLPVLGLGWIAIGGAR